MVDLHGVAQALAGADHLGDHTVGYGIDGSALRGHQVQAVMLHLQLVYRIVFHAHGGAGLHIGHVVKRQGERRNAVPPFPQDAEHFLEIGIHAAGHEHKRTRSGGGGTHVEVLGEGIGQGNQVGGRHGIRGGQRGLEQAFVDGVILVGEALHHVGDELFLFYHLGIALAVQAVLTLQLAFLGRGEEEGEEHVQRDGEGHRGYQVADDGGQDGLETGFLLHHCCHSCLRTMVK